MMAWWWRNVDARISALLAVATVVVLRFTSTSVGLVRDEGYYFKAAEDYVTWYRNLWSGITPLSQALQPAVVDRWFSYNHEHPALVKTAQGMAWWLWHQVLHVGLGSEAFRLPGPLFAAVAVVCTYLLGARFYGRSVGVAAAVAWALLPRNFFHEHLACFDVPVTAMTVLVVTVYVYAGNNARRAVWSGLAFGLCMATKHNSLFIVPLLLVHWLVTEGHRFRRSGSYIHVPAVPLALVLMLVLGPVVFYAHWPWLWHNTLRRVGEYYSYHFLHHEHYPITYFGALLRQPPFPYGFAFGMSALTVPLPVLGLAVWGLGKCIRDGFFTTAPAGTRAAALRSHAWLLGPFALVPMLIISLPNTPIFGGTKHWMPATPFLCIMAARALMEGLATVQQELAPRHNWLTAAAAPLFALTCVAGIMRSHPHGQSYYNELAGGARGAASWGFQRHYWGEGARPLLALVNQRAPQGARVFFNRTNYDSWRMYLRDGVLRTDVGYARSVAESQAVMAYHQWEHEGELYNTWNIYRSRTPAAGEYLEGGVPLVTLYFR